MTQYAVCYTLENPPPGVELVCFNRLTGGDTPAETLAKIKAAAAAAAVKDVAGKAAPPPAAPAPAPAPAAASAPAPAAASAPAPAEAAEAMAKWSEVMSNWAQGNFSESVGFSRDIYAERYFAADCTLNLVATPLRKTFKGPEGATEWFADKDDFDFGKAPYEVIASPTAADTIHQKAPGGVYCTWTIRGGMVHAFVAKPRADWAALEAGTASSSADPLAPLKAAEPDEITEEDWAKAVVVGGDRVSAADAHLPLLGQRCTIVGLTGRADLNGRRGTARRWNAAKERLEFSLDKSDAGQKVILVRPVNLQRLEGDSRERAAADARAAVASGEEVRFVTCPLCRVEIAAKSEAECMEHMQTCAAFAAKHGGQRAGGAG